LINVNSTPGPSPEIVTGWTVTILADTVPEASTWALLVVAAATLWFVRRRKAAEKN